MPNIDERVVQLQFDNRDFEKNIQDTMRDLEKFEKSLEMRGASSGLDEVTKSISDLADNVDILTHRFSVCGEMVHNFWMGVADKAISFVTGNINKAKNALADMSDLGQATAGMDKYEQKMGNVKTIMNATGKSIEEVSEILDGLMFYSDETSYSFANMTTSLAQLTSAGGNVEKLVPMIEGIANATAYAGKGATEFSRAIYNLNQSYSAGSLKYMDWKSIDQAGVSSKQLKQTFIDTAIELGKLNEEGKTLDGKTLVTVSSFNETLSKNWADRDVMEAAFGKFAEFTETVKAATEGDLEKVEEAYKKAGKVIPKAVKDIVSAGGFDTGTSAIQAMSKDFDDISVKAFLAAQEAKTFSEAVAAIKDVVSSSWMTSFEYIFGNVEEATEIWSGLYEVLYEIVGVTGELRNEMLKEWRSLGGREMLLESLSQAYEHFKEALGAVADAWREVFPKSSQNALFEFTKKFNKFVKETKLSKQTLEQISKIVKLFATGLKGVLEVVDRLRIILGPVFQILDGIGHQILTFLSYLSDLIISEEKIAARTKFLIPIFNTIKTVLAVIALTLANLAIITINLITELLKLEVVQNVLNYISTGFEYLKGIATTALGLIVAGVVGLINTINSIRQIGFKATFDELISKIKEVWTALTGKDETTIGTGIHGALQGTITGAEESLSFLDSIVERVQETGRRIADVFGFIGYVIAVTLDGLFGDGAEFRRKMEGVMTTLNTIGKTIDLTKIVAVGFAIAIGHIGLTMERFIMSLTGLVTAFTKLTNGINIFDFFNSLKTGILTFNKTLKAAVFGNNVVKFAVAIGILAASIMLLSGIPTGDLWAVTSVIAAVAAIIAVASAGIAYAASNMPDKFAMTGLAITMVGFAAIVASLAYLVKSVEAVAQSDKAFNAFAATIAILGEVLFGMIMLMKIPDIGPGFDPFKFLAIISLGGAIKNMAVGISEMLVAMKDIEDPNIIWRATATIAAMMSLFAVLMRSTKNISAGSGFVMGAIILSIKSLGSLLQIMGAMDAKGAANCSTIIDSIGVVVMGIIAVSGLMLRNSKSIEAFSDMMATVSFSVLMLGATVGIMSYIAMYDPTLLGEGLFGLATLFGAYIGFCKMMKSNASTIADAGNSFKGFGKGLLMLVGALGIFTYLTKDNKAALDDALVILGTLTVVYGAIQALMHFTQTKVTGREFDGLAAIGGAVLAIASAAKLLENIDPIGLDRATGILVAVSAAFLGFSYLMNGKMFNGTGMIKAACSILLLAIAVDTLIPAIAILALFPIDQVLAASAGISGIMVAMGFLISNIGDKDAQITTMKIVGLVGMIGALAVLMGVLGYVMSPEAIKPVLAGVGAIAIVLFSMAKMLEIIGKIKDPKSLVGPIVSLGVLMLSLGGAIALVGYFSKDAGTALAGGAGILLSVLMLSELIGIITKVKNVKAAVGVLLSLSVLVGALGFALGNLASFDAINIGASAASIVGVLVVLGVLTKILSTIDQIKMITAAGGLIAISVAVGIISLSLSELASVMSQLTPGQMLEMGAGLMGVILAMTAVLGILGGLSLILTPVGMGGAIIALASITAAFYAFSFALTMLLPVLESFCTNVFPAFGNMVQTIGNTIVYTITGISNAISNGFSTFMLTLSTGLESILTSIVAFGLGMGTIPYSVIATGLLAVGSALAFLSSFGPIIFAGGTMVAGGIAAIATAGSMAIPVIVEATDALLHLVNAVSTISDSETFKEIGEWIPKSLAAGISMAESAESACESLGSRIEEAIRDRLGIHSPSEIFFGIAQWIAPSLAQGMLSNKSVAGDAAAAIGDTTIEEVVKSIKNGSPEAIGSFVDGIDINKPDIVSQIRSNTGAGLSNAISGLTGMMSNLGINLGDSFLGSFFKTVSGGLGTMFASNKPIVVRDTMEEGFTHSEKVRKRKEEEEQKKKEEAEKKAAANMASAGKSGGKNASKAAKETEKVADVTEYAADVIERFKINLMEADETLSETEAYEMATQQVRDLTEHIWELNATEEELALTGDDREKAIKKSFEAWEDSASEAVGGSINLLQKFEREFGKTLKDMNKNIASNYDATKEYMKYMKLGAEFMPEDTWNYFRNQGVEAIDDLRAYMIASTSEQEYFNENMFKWDDKVTDAQMELIELEAKVADRSARTAEGVETAEEKKVRAMQENTARMSAKAEEQMLLFDQIAESAKSAMGSISGLFGDFDEWEDKTYENLVDSLEKQVNLFEAFKDTADLSSSELLDNMQSQLDGVQEWSNDMDKLGARGLADGLMQKLADMGVQGYEYVKAFSEMTDEELKQANDMFAKAEPGQKEAAKKVSDSFTHQLKESMDEEMNKVLDRMEEFGDAISEMLADGFDPKYMQEALDSGLLNITNYAKFQENADIIEEKIGHMFELQEDTLNMIRNQGNAVGTTLVEGMSVGTSGEAATLVAAEAIDTVAKAIDGGKLNLIGVGETYDSSMAKGIESNKQVVITESLNTTEEALNETNAKVTNLETGSYKVGWNISDGLKEGILAGKSMVIQAAIDVALAAIEAAEDELDINSPSRVFATIGEYCDMGFAKGLYSGERNVTTASYDMSNSVVSVVKEAMTSINSIINDSIDLDPTIRPVLDLSDIESKKQSLGAMFSGIGFRMNTSSIAIRTSGSVDARKIAGNGDNSGLHEGASAPQYNFTQNNYSPKSLSRIEIYRQTNNQFNHFKNTITGNNPSVAW